MGYGEKVLYGSLMAIAGSAFIYFITKEDDEEKKKRTENPYIYDNTNEFLGGVGSSGGKDENNENNKNTTDKKKNIYELCKIVLNPSADIKELIQSLVELTNLSSFTKCQTFMIEQGIIERLIVIQEECETTMIGSPLHQVRKNSTWLLANLASVPASHTSFISNSNFNNISIFIKPLIKTLKGRINVMEEKFYLELCLQALMNLSLMENTVDLLCDVGYNTGTEETEKISSENSNLFLFIDILIHIFTDIQLPTLRHAALKIIGNLIQTEKGMKLVNHPDLRTRQILFQHKNDTQENQGIKDKLDFILEKLN